MPQVRIVVIDDDVMTLAFIVSILSAAEYEVTTCDTAANAVECIHQEQPDLVILDLQIDAPLAGWEILGRMRIHGATARIPVILYSTEQDFFYEHRHAIRSLRAEVLKKPFSAEELLMQVEALTNKANEQGGPRY